MTTHAEAEHRVTTGFGIHLIVYLLVVGGLAAMNYQRNPDNLWVLWVAGGWGLGVALHAVNVFLRPAQREKMIARTAERMDRREARR